MEQVFGYFDYVEFEIYDGFLRVRYDKPRIQGLHKIVVIDRIFNGDYDEAISQIEDMYGLEYFDDYLAND